MEEIKDPENDPDSEEPCYNAIDFLTRGLDSANVLMSDEIKAKINYRLGNIYNKKLYKCNDNKRLTLYKRAKEFY